MAPRYIALTRLEGKARPQAMLDGFREIFYNGDIVIFASDDLDNIPLTNDKGIVLGALFSRSPLDRRIHQFDEATSVRLNQSLGRTLITGYWGNYVALLANGPNVSVLRDPSGALPVYYVNVDGVTAISSDIETLVSWGYAPTGIDWRFFPGHFQALDHRTPQTALSGVTELLAGQCLKLTSDRLQVDTYWSPWDYTAPNSRSSEEVRQNLRETVIGCIGALAKVYSQTLLGVSGGLDSSVIAASLALSGAQPVLFTMATMDASGDERPHARQLAEALAIPLEEAFYDLDHVDLLTPSAAHLPRPIQFAYGQAETSVRFRLAHTYSADAVFSGIGGDNVFCLMQSASPFLDRILSEGLGRGALQTLNDICTLAQCSMGEVIRMAAERYFKFHRGYIWQADTSFLHPDILAAHPFKTTHPWLEAPAHTLPGKAAHVAMLARIQGSIDGLSRIGRPPQILPLLSQPVVEACLSIPTWEWVAKGQNRSVLRDAFADDLPPAIIRRRTKRGPTGFSFEVLERQRDALREPLLDGVLAQQGFIDRAAVESALNGKRALHGRADGRLFVFAEAEMWVRHWQERIRNAPANGQMTAPAVA